MRPSSPGPTGDPHDVAGAAHFVARLDRIDVVEQHAADAVALQRLREAVLAAWRSAAIRRAAPRAGRRPARRRRRLPRRGRSPRSSPEVGGVDVAPRAGEPVLRGGFSFGRHGAASGGWRRDRRARNWRSKARASEFEARDERGIGLEDEPAAAERLQDRAAAAASSSDAERRGADDLEFDALGDRGMSERSRAARGSRRSAS